MMEGFGFTGSIGLEAAALGKALLAGAVMGVYYDLFRILRRIFRFGYAMILAQDVFFWLTAAVGVFFSSIVVYEGQLRILFVLAALAGWGVYAATVGSLLMTVVDLVLRMLRRLAAFIKLRMLEPIKKRLRCAVGRITAPIKCKITEFFADFRNKKAKNTQNRQNTA